MRKFTGVVLAGGKSSRMGEDKGLISVEGQAMVQASINLLKSVTERIIIISNNEVYEQFGYEVFKDILPNKGPMGGILTGLINSNTEDIICLTCDMPYLTDAVIDKLITYSEEGSPTIIQYKDRLQPLVGIYNRALIPQIQSDIENDKLKILKLLDEIEHQVLSLLENEVGSKVFLNLNKKEDLKK